MSLAIDTILITGFDYEFIELFQQITKLGHPIKVICATANECIFTDVVQSSSPGALNGTLAVDIVPPGLESSGFANTYQQKYPNYNFSELVYAAVGYDTTTIAAKAMEQCGLGDSECIVDALAELKAYPSVLGSHGFDQDRILQIDMRMYEFRDGKWNVLED